MEFRGFSRFDATERICWLGWPTFHLGIMLRSVRVADSEKAHEERLLNAYENE